MQGIKTGCRSVSLRKTLSFVIISLLENDDLAGEGFYYTKPGWKGSLNIYFLIYATGDNNG